MPDPFPDEIDEKQWDVARRRADIIRRFLRRREHGAATSNIGGLADELGVSVATTYRLIKVFQSGGTVTNLVDRKRGRPEGHRTLDERREEIVRTAIDKFFLKPTRPRFSRLVREIHRLRCGRPEATASSNHQGSPRRYRSRKTCGAPR